MTHAPGNHGLLDLYGCDEAILKDEGRLKTALQVHQDLQQHRRQLAAQKILYQ